MIKRIRTMLLAFLYVVCVFPHPHAKADYDELMIGDHVYLGTLEQDGKTENGKEPLSWTVIDADDNYCLLITDRIIEHKPFDSKKDSNVNWSNSEIRTWMNEELFREIFTESEQEIILPISTGESDGSIEYESIDKIFLLSRNEVDHYILSSKARIIHSYDQTEEDNHFESWWTRTSSSKARAILADNTGKPIKMIFAYGVRPVIVVPKSDVTVRPFLLPERDEYKYVMNRVIRNTAPSECMHKLTYCTEKYFSEKYDIAGRKKIKRKSSYSYKLINLKTGEVLSFDDSVSNLAPNSYKISSGGSMASLEDYNFEQIEMSEAVKGFFR